MSEARYEEDHEYKSPAIADIGPEPSTGRLMSFFFVGGRAVEKH